MKIKIQIALVLFMLTAITQAQTIYPTVRNISTNPLNPYNTEWSPYLLAAAEVAENGLPLGETQTQQTRLVEELTLRLLQMEERIVELEGQLAKQ